jgi:hypothetical protein
MTPAPWHSAGVFQDNGRLLQECSSVRLEGEQSHPDAGGLLGTGVGTLPLETTILVL